MITMTVDEKDGGNPLEKAVEHLEKDAERLRELRAEEAAVERDALKTAREIEELAEDADHVVVHVTHVNEAEKVSFKEKLSATLQQVWDKAYRELKIDKKPKDIFQTAGEHPKSLMNNLGMTLKQAHHDKVITDYRFDIAQETGGA